MAEVGDDRPPSHTRRYAASWRSARRGVDVARESNAPGGSACEPGERSLRRGGRFIFSDLNTWGWIILFIGIIQLFAAFSIWSGGQFGRWIGIIGASLSAIGALLSIPGYPFWSLAIFGLDLLIIYGLSAYGGQRARTA